MGLGRRLRNLARQCTNMARRLHCAFSGCVRWLAFSHWRTRVDRCIRDRPSASHVRVWEGGAAAAWVARASAEEQLRKLRPLPCCAALHLPIKLAQDPSTPPVTPASHFPTRQVVSRDVCPHTQQGVWYNFSSKFRTVLFIYIKHPDPAIRWEMVNAGHEQIGWSVDGTTLVITNPERLASHVLPKYFRRSQYSSWVRAPPPGLMPQL